jgi:hypothetical protein
MSLISKSNVSEPARISNPLFADLTWRTDVLFTQQGLDAAKECVPVLEVISLLPRVLGRIDIRELEFHLCCNKLGKTGDTYTSESSTTFSSGGAETPAFTLRELKSQNPQGRLLLGFVSLPIDR